MNMVYPSTAERAAVVTALAKHYTRRLALSAATTSVDGLALVFAGRNVYQAAHLAPLLAVAFVLLAISLLFSLGHIWFLTFRVGHMLRSVQLQPEP